MFSQPTGCATASNGDLYVADNLNLRVRVISAPSALVSTVAGSGLRAFTVDGPATSAGFNGVYKVGVDGDMNFYFSEPGDGALRLVNGSTGMLLPPFYAYYMQFGAPAVACDSFGNVIFGDGYQLRWADKATGVVSLLAGSGRFGHAGDNGPATAADLSSFNDAVLHDDGSVWIADTYNCAIRFVSISRDISTVAGTIDPASGPQCGNSGDGGPATNAQLGSPRGVAVDSQLNMFIAGGSGPF